MKKFKFNRARKFSLGMIIFALFAIWQTSTITPTFTAQLGGTDAGSKLFPYIACAIILITSVLRFLTSGGEGTVFLDAAGWLRLGKILGCFILYVLGLKYIGFVAATFLAAMLLVFVMKLNRSIKWPTLVIFAIILDICLYILFARVLGVVLPRGIFF